MLVAVITLSVLTVCLIYIVYNLLMKNEELEDIVLEQDDTMAVIAKRFNETLLEMRRLDSKGGFESDNEVGSVFKGIKDVINKLDAETKDVE